MKLSLPSWASWSRKSAGSDTWSTFREFFGAMGVSGAGVSVTPESALQVSAVLACALKVANGLAQVPLKLYREADGRRNPAKDHPSYWLLHRRPNPWQTSFEYRQTIGLHLMLCGAHFSFVNRVRGQIVELLPFEPSAVRPRLAADGIELQYDVTLHNGQQVTLSADQVWHVKGPSWCGWNGLKPVRLAREAIGLALAIETDQAQLYRDGIFPSGTYSFDGTLSSEQYKQLRQFLAENQMGKNKRLPMLLDRNAKWLPQRFSGVDAQTLETRRYQVQEICRAMGVMPIMVGLDDKTSTYASAEQMFLAHVVHTLGPWYECLEQSMDVHLLGEEQVRQGYYAHFVVQGLLRASNKDRGEYFARALGAGGAPAWMTQDEVRGLDDLNPLGGDAAQLPKPTNVPGNRPGPAAGNSEDPATTAPQGA